MKATIIRLEATPDHGTFGILRIDGLIFCCTLEPWMDQRIPVGAYICKRVRSPLVARLTKNLLVETFEITAIPGRSLVRFHPGNVDDDSDGCVLLGETFGKLSGNKAILNSGATFRRFMAAFEEQNSFSLVIRESY